jgi:hypothetical protein
MDQPSGFPLLIIERQAQAGAKAGLKYLRRFSPHPEAACGNVMVLYMVH